MVCGASPSQVITTVTRWVFAGRIARSASAMGAGALPMVNSRMWSGPLSCGHSASTHVRGVVGPPIAVSVTSFSFIEVPFGPVPHRDCPMQ